MELFMITRRAITFLRSITVLLFSFARLTNLIAIVRHIRHIHYVANFATIRRAVSFIVSFALILSSYPTVPRAIGAGKSAEKPKVQLTQGPPGRNLPNLDKVRGITPGVPKAVAASPTPITAVNISSPMASPPMQEVNWPMALIAPENRVGMSGEDLLSRNFNWSAPIVNLPGRAGMDLDLGLSFNSLVWTKSGTNMYFDLGGGFPSPGFRLGLPELGTTFYNPETGTSSALLTMPSGRRYEFRRNPAYNPNIVYEEMGSTYMLLVVKINPLDDLDMTWNLLLTDGTTYKFRPVGNSFKCVEVKDRNGNYISIAYTAFEQIKSITDTLDRVANFNYDGSNRLISITQNWGGGAHTYATFAYDTVTIQTNFPGLNMIGVANGTTIAALSRVDMADGKVYAFEYNTYAQVRTIRCYAPNSANPGAFPGDYTLLSYISYDLTPDAGAPQSDCPRFFSRIDWAKDWNSGALTSYDGDGSTWGSATLPDRTVYKEYFGASGWQRGLTLQTETWSNGSRKKWTTSTWANDNPNVSYWLNPRVVETNVNDEHGGWRKTTMDYADFGAVSDIREYDTPLNPSTVLRRTHFDYLRGSAYTGNLSRRLPQLVTSQTVYDGNGALFSKVTNEYDLPDQQYLVHHNPPPIRHDTAKYGPTFVQGRGNLNVVRRWDVTDRDNIDKSVASTVGYNTSGSVIFSRDPLGHETKLNYADSFSDSVNNRNTLAYPTMVTDADNYSARVQYNYDFGGVTYSQDPKGAAVVTTYDPIGRPERVTNQVNQAYTRYVYAPNHLYVQSFSTVNDLSSEFYQITVVDGHGRVLGVASDHPGSAGGYKAQSYEYDIMGRLVRQTNPTEINGAWEAMGDDPVWVWISQAYDWQGRPTVSTNQDGTTRSTSYEGCGCSGGDVVTLTDEGTLVNGTLQRRKQKIYHDALGRVVKSEIYDWNNNVYTTTTQAYNVLNQTTMTTRQQGSGGASQVTTFVYDGHGRLSTREFPSESAPSSFAYNADDTLQVVTDARGASSAFSYNNRGLVTGITYGAPGEVAATPNLTYSYDEAGNRTSMTDGLGSATYHYDMLSRIDWETRALTGVGSFTINYAYNLSGQLTGVTDPANDSVTYVYNRAGEITAINGSNYAGVTQYAGGLQFRAWGGLKALSYGNGLSLANSYNTRLQLQQMEVKGFVSSGSPSLMKIQHQYYPDGNPKFAQNLIDSRFDRAWTYDHVGRLSEAYTGQEADNYAGVSVPSPKPGPYGLTHQYDAWNNLTSRTGRYWSQTSNLTTTYNGRNQRQGWTYDAAGNLLNDQANQYIYDAAGRNVSSGGVTQAFDGLGQVIKHTGLDNNVTYYLHSTPLGGGVLTEVYGTPGSSVPVGIKIRGYVYAGGVVIAKQVKSGDDYTNSWVEWQHQDALTGSLATSTNVTTNNGDFARQQEMDPMGVNVGLLPPLQSPSGSKPEGMRLAYYSAPDGSFPDGRCTIDGVDISCGAASRLLASGAAGFASEQTAQYNYTSGLFESFQLKKPGTPCSTRKDGKIDGIIGEDGKCHKALGGDNSVTIRGGDQEAGMIILSLTAGEFIGGGWQEKEQEKGQERGPACGLVLTPTVAKAIEALAKTGVSQTERAGLAVMLGRLGGALGLLLSLEAKMGDDHDTRDYDRKPLITYRWAKGLNASEFKPKNRELSTFEHKSTNPDHKYNVPFQGIYYGEKRPNETIAEILGVPEVPGLRAIYTPSALGEHWDLLVPAGISDTDFKEGLSKYAKRIFDCSKP